MSLSHPARASLDRLEGFSEHGVARIVALSFLAAGICWVLFTDLALYALVQDHSLIARLETAKGWAFVGISAGLLYVVAWRCALKLTRVRRTVSAMVDSIADGVLLIGPDRTITYANPAAVRMANVGSAAELIGLSAKEIARRYRVSRPDGSLMSPEQFLIHRVFEEGGSLQHKIVLHPPQRKELILLATAAGVRGKEGVGADLVVSVMHDVTELERLDRMRDQFLSTAAHSLKTPIAILKSNARLLKTRNPSHVARSADAIERQCDRMARLIENLLVLSRLHSGQLHLYPAELDLTRLAERVGDEMAGAWPGREVLVNLAPGPAVYADAERLSLALRNLIDDALRASDRDSAVTLTMRQHGAKVEIGVRHESPVADDELISSDDFQRYDDLGLRRHVARAIVEAHGGSLREESAGLAKITWVILPVMEAPHG